MDLLRILKTRSSVLNARTKTLVKADNAVAAVVDNATHQIAAEAVLNKMMRLDVANKVRRVVVKTLRHNRSSRRGLNSHGSHLKQEPTDWFSNVC